jgi:hypothetical protein
MIKKLLATTAIALFLTSQAFAADTRTDTSKIHAHRGFYFSADLALSYATSEDIVPHWDDKVALKCNGWLPYSEIRVG